MSGKESTLALCSEGTAKNRVTFKIWQYNQNDKQKPLKLTKKITSGFFSCSELPRRHRYAESRAYKRILGNNRIFCTLPVKSHNRETYLFQWASQHTRIPEKMVNFHSLMPRLYYFCLVWRWSITSIGCLG